MYARSEMGRVGSYWGAEGDERWTSWRVGTLGLLAEVAQRYRSGGGAVDARDAGRLVAGLCDIVTRDAAAIGWTRWELGWHSGVDHDQVDDASTILGPDSVAVRLLAAVTTPGGPVGGGGAGCPTAPASVVPTSRERPSASAQGARESGSGMASMWRGLATSCDGTLAVAPLVLLSMHEWASGRGAHAAAAVARSLTLDPDYRMARLMDRVLVLGLAPSWVGRDHEADPGRARSA